MADSISIREGSVASSEDVVGHTEASEPRVQGQHVELDGEQLQQLEDDSSNRTPSLFSTGLNVQCTVYDKT